MGSDPSPPRASEIGKTALLTEIKGLNQLAESLGADFDQAVSMIAGCEGRLVVSGVGKSGHVARKIAATFASTGTAAVHLHAAEAGHGDLGIIGPGDTLLILSKSGQSRELTPLLGFALRRQVPVIAVTTDPASELAKASTCCLALPQADEVDAAIPAPTTSTLMMQALGDALAAALWRQHGFDADAFSQLHPSGSLGAQLRRIEALVADLPVAEIVQPGADLPTCAKAITASGVGCALVGSAAKGIKGIITDGDLRRALLQDKPPTASSIMSASPFFIGLDETAAAALALMEQQQVSQLVVRTEPPRILHLQTLLRSQVA